MKKRIIILIIILFLPVMVEAKEYCTIVSGNGKNIGSEIACGTEHFYVIDGSGENIKMLSKYNLYVGAIFNRIKLDINEIYIKSECGDYGCYENSIYYFEGNQVNDLSEFETKIEEKYNIELTSWYDNVVSNNYKYAIYTEEYGDRYVENGKTYQNSTYKIYPYISITEDMEGYALQNSIALGITGEKTKPNYPIYASLTLFNKGTYLSYSIKSIDNFENGYTNFESQDNAEIQKYLSVYSNNLKNMGYEVSNIDLINIGELNNIVYKVTNKKLPLSKWYNDSLNSDIISQDEDYYTVGDLKEYLSNDYSWIWSTSYWTKTFVGNDVDLNNDYPYNHNVYFVSTVGEICFSDSSCYTVPRAGLRPVVTISKDNVKYNIKTKTDGKGTIEVVESAYGGEEIRFRVTAKKEYKLIGLTITTDSGEVVEFNEEDIINNNDGTMSISTNKFTMPYDNVLIQARWSSTIINPSTGVSILFILFMLFIIDFSIIYVMAIRKRQVN